MYLLKFLGYTTTNNLAIINEVTFALQTMLSRVCNKVLERGTRPKAVQYSTRYVQIKTIQNKQIKMYFNTQKLLNLVLILEKNNHFVIKN